MRDKCFACGRPCGANPHIADTRDAQIVYVGSDCWKRIKIAGDTGYQPPRGGPRLYLCPKGADQQTINDWHVSAKSLKKSNL